MNNLNIKELSFKEQRKLLESNLDTLTSEQLEELSESNSWIVRASVAEQENCPLNVLEKLSNDEHLFPRFNVALHKNCPTNILEKLSKDKCFGVRFNVVLNKNCSSDLLEQLHKEFSFAVEKHPKCPENLKNKQSNLIVEKNN